jgi:hypothetical protein
MLTDASLNFKDKPRTAMLTRAGVMCLMFLVPELPALAVEKSNVPPGSGNPSCSLRHIDMMLAPYAGDIVLADVSDTPELLYRTQVLTVGSLYHHGILGYLRAREAWRSGPSPMAPDVVIATGAKFVLFCPSSQRYLMVQDLPKQTLWDALEAEKPPGWLTLQATDRKSGWQLYAVAP